MRGAHLRGSGTPHISHDDVFWRLTTTRARSYLALALFALLAAVLAVIALPARALQLAL